MAQYDLHIIQNVHGSGIEFTERMVNLGKGGILSADAANTPVVLAAGTNGYQLVRDDAEVSGMKWVAISGGHTQGTDLGTTSDIFELDSDGNKIELTAESASKFGVKIDGGGSYADLEAKDIIANAIALQSGTIVGAPSAGNDLVNKTYADGLLAANDAMIFKGLVGSGGTHEIAAFNALATYNAGWTYRAITAGTIKGVVCEIGDLITCMVDRAGSGELDSDWTVMQTNLDGAVIGPAGVTDNYLVQFDGVSGKLIKAGSGAPGTMAYENSADYVAKALFDANTILAANADNTPTAITVAEDTLLGRKSGGNIAGLTPAEIMNIISVAAPAAKNSSGAAGEIAFDANYIYRCNATDQWTRGALATNW